MEQFGEDLEAATKAFKDLTTQFGEDEVKEPADFFETLEKFLMRFEAACKDVDDLRKEATPKKGLGRRGPGRPAGVGGGALKIKPKGADVARPAAPAPGTGASASSGAAAAHEAGGADTIPQRRLTGAATEEGKARRPSMFAVLNK